MTRPGGRWVPNGRAKHLVAAAEDSCRALGVERIDLYQLHAPDPRVPLGTSVRALADLRRQGLVERIGLCNVTVSQIDEARRIVEIDSIQVEASLWHDQQFLSGVVRYCVDNRLRLLAYRPLGGRKSRSRAATNPVLVEIAAQCGATPFDVALAWLAGLSETHRPSSWSDRNRHGPIDRAAPNAAADQRADGPPRRVVPGRAPDQEPSRRPPPLSRSRPRGRTPMS